jgi:hypothetical protein
MSTERETTRIVRSWLMTDEHESADRVLDAVLDRLDTTPQRRATWWPARRNETMNMLLRYGIAGALITLVAAIGYVAADRVGTEPAPVESSSAELPWVTFTSDRYGYSIEHPADWRVLEQAGEATMSRMEPRSAGTDTIASALASRYNGQDGAVVIWADELEEGESLDQFTARASGVTDCTTALPAEPTELGGEPARRHSFTCATWDWLQLTAIHDDRGYVMWLVTTMAPPPQDRPINDQFVASFRFTD